MPTIYIEGFAFRFYSLDRPEPPHVHVEKGGKTAKLWLDPVEVQWNRGYNTRELNDVVKLTTEHQQELLHAWHTHFGTR